MPKTEKCVECLEPMGPLDRGDTCNECREYLANEQAQHEEELQESYKAIDDDEA